MRPPVDPPATPLGKVRESGSWQTVLSKLVVGLMSNPSDALLPGKRRCGGDGRTDAYPEQIVKVRIRRHLCLDHDIEFLVLG